MIVTVQTVSEHAQPCGALKARVARIREGFCRPLPRKEARDDRNLRPPVGR